MPAALVLGGCGGGPDLPAPARGAALTGVQVTPLTGMAQALQLGMRGGRLH